MNIDARCVSREPPVIDLQVPPDHGVVCLRRADMKTSEVYSGQGSQCLGRKAAGIAVFYLPPHGYMGGDALRDAVRSPLGPITYTFKADDRT